MTVKVGDISIEELKKIISDTVKEAIDDKLEDIEALMSKNYINSIREARDQYNKGEYLEFNEVFK